MFIRPLLLIVSCVSVSFMTLAQPSTRIIDMHLNSYNKDHYIGSVVHAGLEPSKNYKAHFEETYKMLGKYNIVKGVIANDKNAIDTWKDQDEENRILWGSGMFYPHELSVADFEQLIVDNKIHAYGELPPVYYPHGILNKGNKPYLQVCEKHGIPVFIYLGSSSMKVRYNTSPDRRLADDDPQRLEGIMKDYPKLKIHLLHSFEVYPYMEEIIDLMKKYENIYVSLGSVLWYGPKHKQYANDFLRRTKEEGVIEKVMFGSNQQYWPESIKLSIDFLNTRGFLTVAEKKGIFYDNAAKFLELE